jgi:hypothetical protein
MQYEEGSIPAKAWNEATLAVVAGWYAKNQPRAQAQERYAKYYHRNHRRLMTRLDSASIDQAAIDALDAVWESLLTRVLPSAE